MESYVKLREYQSSAVSCVFNALERGETSLLVSIPTGGGKSVVIAEIVRLLLNKGLRILIAIHSRELVQQNSLALERIGVKHGIVSAGLGSCRIELVSVGTVQTITSKKNLQAMIDYKFDYLIVDEAHRVDLKNSDSQYARLFRAIHRQIGFTATPYRHGKNCLVGDKPYNPFKEIVYDVTIKRLVVQKYLSPLTVKIPDIINVAGVKKNATGDFDTKATEERVIDIVEKHIAVIQDILLSRKKTLIFSVSVQHSRLINACLNDTGITSMTLDGQTTLMERDKIIQDFKDGKIKCLVNCQVLTTGFDVADIDCIVLLRPTLSKVLYTQMIGRGTRRAEGKEDCLILDFGGNLERFGIYPNKDSVQTTKLLLCANHDHCMNWIFETSQSVLCNECQSDEEIVNFYKEEQEKEAKEQELAKKINGLNLYQDQIKNKFDKLRVDDYISSSGVRCIKIIFYDSQQQKIVHQQYFAAGTKQSNGRVERFMIDKILKDVLYYFDNLLLKEERLCLNSLTSYYSFDVIFANIKSCLETINKMSDKVFYCVLSLKEGTKFKSLVKVGVGGERQ